MLHVTHKLILLIALTWISQVNAKGTYQTPEDFLSQTFGETPEAARILLKGDLTKDIKEILGHRYKKIRLPYWQEGCRTAWILEEIGKEQPITTGFVVNSQGLEKVKVLIFRESRGWEVKHDFFSQQFIGVNLNSKNKLDKSIDNISGATMSVDAITGISRMALLLHDHVTKESC